MKLHLRRSPCLQIGAVSARFPKRIVCPLIALLLCACGGAADTPNGSTSCGAAADSLWLNGTVSAVHDGDTLSLETGHGSERIRLQGLDAPELAQAYGSTAQQALSDRALHQSVRVAYGQRDAYNRVLGQVFTGNCQDLNLQLLQTGMAWFYKAYACELDSSRRSRYILAESQAKALRQGLWSQSQPEAPWVYRNGEDPAMPVCAN